MHFYTHYNLKLKVLIDEIHERSRKNCQLMLDKNPPSLTLLRQLQEAGTISSSQIYSLAQKIVNSMETKTEQTGTEFCFTKEQLQEALSRHYLFHRFNYSDILVLIPPTGDPIFPISTHPRLLDQLNEEAKDPDAGTKRFSYNEFGELQYEQDYNPNFTYYTKENGQYIQIGEVVDGVIACYVPDTKQYSTTHTSSVDLSTRLMQPNIQFRYLDFPKRDILISTHPQLLTQFNNLTQKYTVLFKEDKGWYLSYTFLFKGDKGWYASQITPQDSKLISELTKDETSVDIIVVVSCMPTKFEKFDTLGKFHSALLLWYNQHKYFGVIMMQLPNLE